MSRPRPGNWFLPLLAIGVTALALTGGLSTGQDEPPPPPGTEMPPYTPPPDMPPPQTCLPLPIPEL